MSPTVPAPRAYFNEFDLQAAEWLRNLIGAGLLPEGDVDGRDIREVRPDDLKGYTSAHFFAGVGGWPHALRLAGWPDALPVWTGSCPCQPYSSAGKQEGDDDPRNLWPEFFRLIRECRPECVFGEQVEGAIRHGWLDGVSADLEGEGYAVGAAVLGAHSVGAPHIRQRLYWVADSQSAGGRADAGSVRGGAAAGLRTPEGKDQRRPGEQARWTGDSCPTGVVADPERLRDDPRGRHEAEPSRDGPDDGLFGRSGGGLRGPGGRADDPECGCRQGRPDLCRCGSRVRAEGDGGRSADGRDAGRTAGTVAEPDRSVLCGLPPTGEQPVDEQDGGTGRGVPLGDAVGPRREGRGAGVRGEPGHGGGRESVAPTGDAGFWSAFDLIPCWDGQARRVEPGSFPLAHGIPRELGPLLAVLERMGVDPRCAKLAVRNARGRLAKAGRNRTGRLRGYGNAIVPEDAEAFVRAYREATVTR